MTRFTVLLLALLHGLLFCTAQAQAAELVASVDRSRLSSGETVELTLESSDVTQFGKPDLTALEPLFEVRGTRQVNQLNTLSGENQATTRWIVTLLPRQNGSVVIPSLQLGELQSQPITLQVVESETQDNPDKRAAVFIDASLDQTSVYVQAQAVLTLRIYHSVSLYDDSSLPPLQIPDARIEQLGESRTYEKGHRRPAPRRDRNALRDLPATQWRTDHSGTGLQRRAGRPTTGTGLSPRAQSRQADARHLGRVAVDGQGQTHHLSGRCPWLPARSLTLSESWSPEPDHTQVGDSLTRSLTVKAEGLSSTQLPPLPGTDVGDLRRYPDQPVLGNQNSERGLVGSREDREALVPTRTGAIELPTVDVVWWNTFEDHLEHSSLPARTLHVAANPSLMADTPADASPVDAGADSEALWRWKLSTLILACTTLLGFGLWWRGRWQPAVARVAQTGLSPRTVLDDLKRACQANDSHATRQALDAWARQQPETLADMAARFVPLSDALDGLNGALYSETGQHWQGDELWRVIKAIPMAERVQDPVGDSRLPPLYPK